jgi:co-chaperonin GroES (HSP10)
MDRKSVGNTVMLKEVTEDNMDVQGDIFIPEVAKKETKIWEVVGLGTGVKDKNGKNTPFKVKVGEMVFVDTENHVPTTVYLNNEKIMIINQNGIIAKVEKNG